MKITKLNARILKKIIAEEQEKLLSEGQESKNNASKNKKSNHDRSINQETLRMLRTEQNKSLSKARRLYEIRKKLRQLLILKGI
jgi:hypothetical protein